MGLSEDRERITKLVEELSRAAKAYYQDGVEIMPNIEYDRLYDELLMLEERTGIVLASSPTRKVGYEVLSELPKERHASPMLSLDKTKSVETLLEWLGTHEGILSWKLDGLTVVLSYEGGRLIKAVTRGNGEIGEVITQNAENFDNVPHAIPFSGKLILRGEALIRYSDFEKINERIPDADARYKNPRNLCSGSVRQLDPSVTRERHVKLIAFSLVSAEDAAGNELSFDNSFEKQFLWLKEQGFDVVEYRRVNGETLPEAVQAFKAAITENDFPSDGLVLTFDDLAYGISLGRTAKFPRNAIAFKWADETAETVLREMEWSASRTGLINPVAIFDPVELEGTTVTRASVHNLSIVEELGLGLGDHLLVYKANMIIPQIAENLTKSGTLEIPEHCPVCKMKTEVRKDNDAAYLYCTNPDCPAKKIKSFQLMVSRDALNIDGLSEMTLEKFIAEGFIHEYADLFRLAEHHDRIVELEGFGEKSYQNMIAACERARETELYRVIYGLGISGIGLAGAKLLCRTFGNDITALRHASEDELCAVDGIGGVLAASFAGYFREEKNNRAVDDLLSVLKLKQTEAEEETADGLKTVEAGGREYRVSPELFAGKTFVITGDVGQFKNRRAVQALIEALGGKAAGSVSAKTSYLINNDSMSGSSKNKKAKELGVPVITEEEFIKMLE
ncbi:MAG: NAD-dependent DNA ligase LigA [Eubacteriales bacterium]|nr:NAD-dependent DNA ligase LigA [Eubacteriales bacterium]